VAPEQPPAAEGGEQCVIENLVHRAPGFRDVRQVRRPEQRRVQEFGEFRETEGTDEAVLVPENDEAVRPARRERLAFDGDVARLEVGRDVGRAVARVHDQRLALLLPRP